MVADEREKEGNNRWREIGKTKKWQSAGKIETSIYIYVCVMEEIKEN